MTMRSSNFTDDDVLYPGLAAFMLLGILLQYFFEHVSSRQ